MSASTNEIDPTLRQGNKTEQQQIRQRGVRRGMNLLSPGLKYDLRETIPNLPDTPLGEAFLDGYSEGLAARLLRLTEKQTVHRLKYDLTSEETRVLGEYKGAVRTFLKASQKAGRQLGTTHNAITNRDRSE